MRHECEYCKYEDLELDEEPCDSCVNRSGWEPKEMDKKEDITTDFSEFLDELFSSMKELLIKKRHDYGKSYEEIRKRFGDIVPLIRLNDKIMRYENLVSKKEIPENEPILDIFYDIIGYAVLEIEFRTKDLVKSNEGFKETDENM